MYIKTLDVHKRKVMINVKCFFVKRTLVLKRKFRLLCETTSKRGDGRQELFNCYLS